MLRNFFTGAASLALLFGAFTQADAANTPPKIGLVQIDLSNPFHLGEVDGAKEAVIDGRSGFVIPPFDKQKLGSAIETLNLLRTGALVARSTWRLPFSEWFSGKNREGH